MNSFLGVPGDSTLQRDCSEQTAREIDEEVKKILDAAYAESKRVLQRHRSQLDLVASELLQRETLDAQTFKNLSIQRHRCSLKGCGNLPIKKILSSCAKVCRCQNSSPTWT